MMQRKFATIAVAVALGFTGALAACSDDDDEGSTTEVTTVDGSSSALPPVIVEVDSLDGSTVEVPVGGAVDITGDDETYLDWTAEIADTAIVSFVPGRDDGSATFNPGLQALAAGSTEVTMTNSSSGTTLTFTVDVTEG